MAVKDSSNLEDEEVELNDNEVVGAEPELKEMLNIYFGDGHCEDYATLAFYYI